MKISRRVTTTAAISVIMLGAAGVAVGPHREGCCRELDTIDILSQREVAGVEFTTLARECA